MVNVLQNTIQSFNMWGLWNRDWKVCLHTFPGIDFCLLDGGDLVKQGNDKVVWLVRAPECPPHIESSQIKNTFPAYVTWWYLRISQNYHIKGINIHQVVVCTFLKCSSYHFSCLPSHQRHQCLSLIIQGRHCTIGSVMHNIALWTEM